MKLLLASLTIFAVVSAPLADPEQEARAQDLMREIRCVACENEPVSQSAAPIAEDMRARIRELVAEGKSDEEVRAWFEDRYGEFVLFRPKAEGAGWLLWLGPFALLLLGAGVGYGLFARRSSGGDVVAEAPEDAS